MNAGNYLDKKADPNRRNMASLRAYTKTGHWWHVHEDELVPRGKKLEIVYR